MIRTLPSAPLATLAAALLFGPLVASQAADRTWGGGDSVWTDTTTSGWNGSPPASGDSAGIPAGTVAATTNNQQGGVAVTVGGSGLLRSGEYYLTPGGLTLADGGTVALQNTSHYANYGGGWLPATITVTGSAPAGSFLTGDTVHAYWNLSNGTVFDVADVSGNADPDLTVSAGLKDAVGSPDTTWASSGIVKTGAGTMVLTRANSYTGGTTVLAGTLRAGSAQAFGATASTVTVNGGWLDLNGFAHTLGSLNGGSAGGVRGGTGALSVLSIGGGNNSSSFGGALEGNLALVKTGSGTLTLSGAVAPNGLITVEEGTLDLSAGTVAAHVRIHVAPGAFLRLPATAINKVYLDNVKLAPGRWGGPGSVAAGLADHESPVFAGSGVFTVADTGMSSRERWKTMKHGLFVHYVWDGFGGVTHNADGSSPGSVNDVADRFDAAGFANDLESMGVEYVIFTAWHSLFHPLFNSSAMESYFPGRCPSRDMIGDMIAAVRAKGIRVLLYTHPMQPISWDYNTHNNLINDVHAELVERYGDQIEGLFLDENDVNANQDSFVDYPRLVATIRRRNPELVLIQNYTGNIYSCDMLHYETGDPRNDYSNNPAASWTTPTPTTQLLTPHWSALLPKVPTPSAAISRTAEGIFRTAVVGAGSSVMGGGWMWAAGPYPGDGTWTINGTPTFIGRWEQGVLEAMQGAAAYIAPVAVSIKNTHPSTSWLTKPYTHITALPHRIVATRSIDDTTEYIHVLNPPANRTLTLPAPADGKVFTNARLLKNGRAVTLARSSRGMTLTLSAADNWETLDTVIVMDVASPGGRGLINNNSPAVAYTGASWTYQTGRGAREFQDDVHYATANGDSLVFTFDGTDIDFLSTRGPHQGTVEVYLDDVFQQTVDLFHADTFNTTAFSRSDLPRGRHTLKLVKTSGQYLTVDAFKVTERINSDDPSLVYSGTWSANASVGAVGGEVRESNTNGDSVTINFEGSGVDLIAPRGVGGGTVKVHLNDSYTTDVPQSSIWPVDQAVTFTSTHVLDAGANKLTITKNRGAWMRVDAFRVYKGPSTPALLWGASGGGGTGTWNVNNTANWYDGVAATRWQDFGGTDYMAVFGGTAGTVSLAANVKANRLTFNTTGYILQTNALTLNGVAPVITTSGGVTATIRSPLAGVAGLRKDGPGTLNLTSGSNSHTGPTSVLGGTLSLGNGSANANLADASPVSVEAGATLNLNYSGTDTVNALAFAGIARPPGVYSAANSPFLAGAGTLTVLTGPATDYAGWAAFHALAGGQTDDDDHDGPSNIEEYVFGLDPADADSQKALDARPDAATIAITYTRRLPALTGLGYRIWYTTDLNGSWTEDTGAVQSVVATRGDVETVRVVPGPAMPVDHLLYIRISAQ